MQRTDGVVKLLAAFVVTAHAFAQHFHQPSIRQQRQLFTLRRHRQSFQGIEQSSGVSIGISDQARLCLIVKCGHRINGSRFVDDLRQVIFRQRLQHIHRSTRQQGRVHFKRRVLRGRTDEGKQTGFHMRQKRVLLAFVETVHFIDKHNRAFLFQRIPCRLRHLHSFADFLDATEYRADR